MKTHEIKVKLMCNPRGYALATLAVIEADEMTRTRFTYHEKVKAEHTIEELSAFVAAFTETLFRGSGLTEPKLAFRVDVQELYVEPKDENRCAMAGVFSAMTLLKKMKGQGV